jgi:hypothetical protein
MAQDHRMPDDTLWFIIEEDFRWYPVGQDPGKCDGYLSRADSTKKLRDGVWKSLPPRGTIALDMQQSGPDPREPTASGKGKGKKKAVRPQTEYHQALPRGYSMGGHVDEGFQQNVADLVRTATFASRQGIGEVLWTSWCPRGKKPGAYSSGKTIIAHGSTCILMTKLGFAQLGAAVQAGKIQSGHIDQVMLRWLRQDAGKVGASYLYPSSGSFTEHASECAPNQYGAKQGGRQSGFDTDSPAWGTRVSSDPEQRQKSLVQWQPKDSSRWVSLPPDHLLHSEAYRWQSYQDESSREGKSAGKGLDRQEEVDEAGASTQRAKRHRRNWERQSRTYRYWVTDPQQAVDDVAVAVVVALVSQSVAMTVLVVVAVVFVVVAVMLVVLM